MKIAGMLKNTLPAVAALLLLNLMAGVFHTRWDLTEDRRFTLAPPSEEAVDLLEGPVVIDVLLEGNLPPEFVRLQRETRLLLEQFQDRNPGITFAFMDPAAESADPAGVQKQLQQIGLKPARVTTRENGRVSQEVLFPWAMITYGNQTEKVPLLKNQLGADTEQRVNTSIESLEYAFADAFSKLGVQEKKKVAVLRGNGELADVYLSDFLTELQGYYNIAPFTLDSVAHAPGRTLEQLAAYDAALIAKPTEAFTEAEKLVLDQYMVRGGKTLWLVDAVNMEMDSLLSGGGESLALARDLNLGDLLFRYGVRINPDLVADLYCTQIVLATGEGRDAQYNPLPWIYHPMILSRENHPVNKNLEALRFQFASSIDTVGNAYRKTVLLASSPRSRSEGTPKLIGLDILGQEPNPERFGPGNLPLGVLVEGAFSSAYANRVRPAELPNYQAEGGPNKMIVISDGDLIANQLRNGSPLELGYDKWTNNFYGNKAFLINAMNYLLDDRGLVNLRNKQVSIPLLDPARTAERKGRWQLLTIGGPLLLVIGIGLAFNAIRKRRYR